jgi:hypothetical protein
VYELPTAPLAVPCSRQCSQVNTHHVLQYVLTQLLPSEFDYIPAAAAAGCAELGDLQGSGAGPGSEEQAAIKPIAVLT